MHVWHRGEECSSGSRWSHFFQRGGEVRCLCVWSWPCTMPTQGLTMFRWERHDTCMPTTCTLCADVTYNVEFIRSRVDVRIRFEGLCFRTAASKCNESECTLHRVETSYIQRCIRIHSHMNYVHIKISLLYNSRGLVSVETSTKGVKRILATQLKAAESQEQRKANIKSIVSKIISVCIYI